jgi:hypothetical protein
LRDLLVGFVENIGLLGGRPILRRVDPLQNHDESAKIAAGTLVNDLFEHQLELTDGPPRPLLDHCHLFVEGFLQQGGEILCAVWKSLLVAGHPFAELSGFWRLAKSDVIGFAIAAGALLDGLSAPTRGFGRGARANAVAGNGAVAIGG